MARTTSTSEFKQLEDPLSTEIHAASQARRLNNYSACIHVAAVLLREMRTLRQGGIDEAKLTVSHEYLDNHQIQAKYTSTEPIAKELVALEDLQRAPVSGWKESKRNFGDGTRTYLR